MMTFLGIWSCQWRELRPINFGGGNGATSASIENSNGDVMDPEDVGYGRGKGRRKGRDGGGEYEMVGMKENDDGNV